MITEAKIYTMRGRLLIIEREKISREELESLLLARLTVAGRNSEN